jgi:LuxR family transcriptional activator of bioluminescence operon
MQTNVADILSDLDALNSERAFKRKFESAFASLGFDSYTYVSMDAEELEKGTLKDYANDVIYMTNLPPLWVAHYVEETYADADPVIRDCLVTRLPIHWTEAYRANARSAQETRMMEDAWENGLRRGLTIPIHGPRGELGIFSLNSQLGDKEFLRVTNETKFDAQVIAYHFHDAVQRTLKAAHNVPLPIPLTEREVEILRWTAAGKTAWEIGGILKISERTVNFHIQNVMEKFGVHNKTHAAAKAMGMGLLA